MPKPSNRVIKSHATQGAGGRLRISKAGGKRLADLRAIAELREHRTLQASVANAKRVKVLFVCSAGIESSKLGLDMFKQFAASKQLPVTLELDYSGVRCPKFKTMLFHFDYIVPMPPGVEKVIKEMTKGLKFKPKIINVQFATIYDQYKRRKYSQIFRRIMNDVSKKKA